MDRSDRHGRLGTHAFLSPWRSSNALLKVTGYVSKNDVSELSLRAVARRARASRGTLPSLPDHEALLVELAMEGFAELRGNRHRRWRRM